MSESTLVKIPHCLKSHAAAHVFTIKRIQMLWLVMSGLQRISIVYLGFSLGSESTKKVLKIAIIFLSISLNMCFGCSKEPSYRDGSFEYPQHMFWLRNKKNNFSYAFLSGGLFLALDLFH